MSHPPVRTLPAMVAILTYLLTPTMYFAIEFYTAQQFSPHYSYRKQFTSDLAIPYGYNDPQTGHRIFSGRAHFMNLNFVANGVLFLSGQLAFLAATAYNPDARLKTIRILVAAFYCIGIILVAAVPSGPKEVENGMVFWHGAGAALAIVLGNVNSLLSGYTAPSDRPFYRFCSMALGGAGLMGFVIMFTKGMEDSRRGMRQRVAIYPTQIWQFLTADLLMSELSKLSKAHEE